MRLYLALALGVLFFTTAVVQFHGVLTCTSLIVHHEASATGAAYVTYNADDSTGFGYLRHFPEADHPPNSRRRVVDGDTMVYHGDIPEAPHTFNVVHRVNSFGVAIGESTWEGLEALQTPFPGSIMDYESLMDIALQRSRTGLEAAGVITGLAELYGWVSLGESFSISDNQYSYILEVIGKGQYGKGVVWMLQTLPEGTVSGHANQPRLTKCPPLSRGCLMHPDTIPLARKLGYKGTDEDFSFSDFFQPLDPATVRACEARVWTAFNKLTDGGMKEYEYYARGWDLSRRMPLAIRPSKPVTREILIEIMRDTYEGTFFAFSDTDHYVGSGAYSAPYRPRPLTFKVGGLTYVNERPIGTQQTLTSHVTELRNDTTLPPQCSAVTWFSVDDTVLSVRLPLHACIREIPPSFSNNFSDVRDLSFESAYWVFNLVANLAYTSFSYIQPLIQAEIDEVYHMHDQALNEMDDYLRHTEFNTAVDNITKRTVAMGESLTTRWFNLWKRLFVKFKDTYILDRVEGQWSPKSTFQAPPPSWYKRVVDESGRRFLLNPDSEKTKDSTA